MPTIAEQILSAKVGRPVEPGEIVRAPVDFAFGHDITLPPAIEEFERLGVETVFDPERIAVIPDHLVPAHNEYAAELYGACEAFAAEHGTVFYPQGSQGQEHVVVPEDGLVKPGDLMVGADSHSCTEGALGAFATGVGSTDLAFAMAFGWLWLRVPETTRVEFVGEPDPWVCGKDLVLAALAELGVDGAVSHAIEFGGPVVRDLPMDDRFTLANMAIEAGAATGIVEPDGITRAFADAHAGGEYAIYVPDDDAEYATVATIDCDGMEPRVAVPNLPANAVSVSEVQTEGVEIDQAVIGSCTNGRESDLRAAAEVLDGSEVAEGVRLIVTPGSRRLERLCVEEGWTATFLDAGATMENPGCGACFGQRTGVLDAGEIAVSTTNRNFTGRMGHPESEVYLASPAVAAASAVAGEIAHPEEVA
ncbi:3-isopropylmalate dehydratase large subunit [Halegenticoccus soli]|uniref:3-isopropylmalate dehydratase large subunit n=1 Tax=Halegenticoccus soli TaxID=1985678 RepID=UPI0018EA9866|nr:3-isopropylmalate dehydratase large subunit [Halegenticoccus soli]